MAMREFIFIVTTGLTLALILAEISENSSIFFPHVTINLYFSSSLNEQPVKNKSRPLNDTINNDTDVSWNFGVSLPGDPNYCQREQTTTCNPFDPYRTIDGSCNNLNHPTWGTANECYLRYQPAYYDGYEGVRKSKNGNPLPLTRDLTLNIFKDVNSPSPNVSFMFTIYGQTVAHDLAHSENLNILQHCCTRVPDHESCMVIRMRSNDAFYSRYNVTCQELHRTLECEICNNTKREQVNGVTAALDASMVYGKDNKRMMDIRANDGTGKLIVNTTEHGELLPTHKGPFDTFCRQKPPGSCFLTGDVRGNQHFFLTSAVTYYVREHNRIATNLKKINPHWKEEKLFQETRIHSAVLQCITYKEYLQILLGPYIMDRFNLTVKNGSEGTKYNPRIRLGVSNEFSTAAFRLHSMIPKKADATGTRFKDFYSKPELIREGRMEEIMQGILKIPSQEYNHYFVDDITNYMAQRPGNSYGVDLCSLDIQRGRDHGLAPYVVMVRFCSEGRVNITTFDDLAPLLMTEKRARMLKENYASVDDIDLFVGLQMENHFPGSIVGPTAGCIIALQFYTNKFGDRFFFEHEDEVSSFTEAQRNSLKQCSLSRILCDNSNITHIPKNAMLLPNVRNPEVPCEDIPGVDLFLWAENQSMQIAPVMIHNCLPILSLLFIQKYKNIL
ncbi:peroxidase-like isoform X2 [Argiope bruennichi]|uniref:peroxidase-like isoform X2 n=1 Tax=Argiope bruennichi TaxID=94029 RepID=UPI002495A882|nr:peroxidase-like isoform X2 [Argiope bruennichi]